MADINKLPKDVDAGELAGAEKVAELSEDTYTYIFKTPFEYEGKTYNELRFDFGSLTGKDDLDIEHELQRLGISMVAAEFSGDYQIRLAAKACTADIGADAFSFMPLKACHAIKIAARSFLLKKE